MPDALTPAVSPPMAHNAAKAAFQQYIACFSSPTIALLDFAARARIAVAYLDREAIEADIDRALTADEWDKIAYQLDGYDEYVSNSDDLNYAFLEQIFADAGVERFIDGDSARSNIDPAVA